MHISDSLKIVNYRKMANEALINKQIEATYSKYAFVTIEFENIVGYFSAIDGGPQLDGQPKVKQLKYYISILQFDKWNEDIKYKFLDDAESFLRKNYNVYAIFKRSCFVFDSYAEASEQLEKRKNITE